MGASFLWFTCQSTKARAHGALLPMTDWLGVSIDTPRGDNGLMNT